MRACAWTRRRPPKLRDPPRAWSSALTRTVVTVIGNAAMDALVGERKTLIARIEQEREQLERMQSIVASLEDRLAHDERMLGEIDSVLGCAPQLRLEDADVRLRGRRLEETAIAVLANERGRGAEIHYREWFELLRSSGHLVAGKDPLNTFLTQINRSASIEKVGRRTGRYRLSAAAA
jgi:hypothetical protein